MREKLHRRPLVCLGNLYTSQMQLKASFNITRSGSNISYLSQKMKCRDYPSLPGYRRRIREVVVSPSSGGKECPPIEEQTECENAQCHQWIIGEWSECHLEDRSQSCGRGFLARNVTCVDAMGVRNDPEGLEPFITPNNPCFQPGTFTQPRVHR